MLSPSIISQPPQLTQKEQTRRAVLRVVSRESPEELTRLGRLSFSEWSELLRWLDMSGMALYLLDRLQVLGKSDLLPAAVMRRLEKNLADNTVRTQAMAAEAEEIRDAFDCAGLSFALLKGLSLCPDSVARPELRSQSDIDFLLAQEDLATAQALLERRGYYLHMVSGRHWEFKTYAVPSASLRDLYRDVPSRSVELHAELAGARWRRLERRVKRIVGGVEMPVVCASDLFIGQGLHLFKHVSSSHYRASHLVEFHRHLQTQRQDSRFWHEVEARAAEVGTAAWALGVVTLLAHQLLGECAPETMLRWTVAPLSGPVRLWVEMYGWRPALSSGTGTKLYALLVRELEKEGLEALGSAQNTEGAVETKSELGAARGNLVPRRLPPMLVRGKMGESLLTKVRRFRLQLWLIFLRLRFCLLEGLRLVMETRRWKSRLKELEEKNSTAVSAMNKGMTIR